MLAHSESCAYSFSPGSLGFIQPTASSRVHFPEAGTADDEALVLKKLGDRGWGRLEHFKLCYSGGWGSGPQKPLSPRSYCALIRTLPVIHPPANVFPSVFLTDNGFLELGWRNETGKAVQIEFGASESEIFDEARGIEQTVPNEELVDFLTKHF